MERKVYAHITTDGHGNMVAEVNGKKYWETMDVARRLDYGQSYYIGEFDESAGDDGWTLADLLDCQYA